MRIAYLGLFGCSAILSSATPLHKTPEFRMRAASAFQEPGAQVQIIGGTLADPGDWPGTFVIDGVCTSTAIGPRAILTAAHCLPDDSTGVVESDGKEILAHCVHHPDYHSNSADFALCELTSDLTDVLAEHVNVSKDQPQENDTVRLLGFGCTELGGSDGGFGVLYEGDSTVVRLPAGSSYYMRTRGGAAVCYGDSGGAAYLFLNAAKTRRVVVGVNSEGDIEQVSLLATTSVPGFVSWLRKWSDERGLQICGIHSNATSCRPI